MAWYWTLTIVAAGIALYLAGCSLLGYVLKRLDGGDDEIDASNRSPASEPGPEYGGKSQCFSCGRAIRYRGYCHACHTGWNE